MDTCLLFNLVPPTDNQAFFISHKLLGDKMTIDIFQASMILGLPRSVQESEPPSILGVTLIPLQLRRSAGIKSWPETNEIIFPLREKKGNLHLFLEQIFICLITCKADEPPKCPLSCSLRGEKLPTRNQLASSTSRSHAFRSQFFYSILCT